MPEARGCGWKGPCLPQRRAGEGGPEAGRCGAAPPTSCYRHCAFKALGSTELHASREPWHPASLGLLIKDTQSPAQTHRGAPPPGDTAREMCRDAAEPCPQKPINGPPLLTSAAGPPALDQALDFPRLTPASGNSRAACPTSTGAGPTLPPPLCSRPSCSPYCWQPGIGLAGSGLEAGRGEGHPVPAPKSGPQSLPAQPSGAEWSQAPRLRS